jgi:hypothetical protein
LLVFVPTILLVTIPERGGSPKLSAQEFRQLRHVRRDPPRLVFGEELGRLFGAVVSAVAAALIT